MKKMTNNSNKKETRRFLVKMVEKVSKTKVLSKRSKKIFLKGYKVPSK